MNAFGLIIKDNFSPNGKFYYKIKFPVSLNPSAFGCEIAFFDRNDGLLYHNQDAYAHEVNDPADIEAKRIESLLPNKTSFPQQDPILRIATWSKQGNIVYILEYFKY